MAGVRKRFFFEKKKQKTFITWLGANYRLRSQGIKNFSLLFLKRPAFSRLTFAGHVCGFMETLY